MGSPHSATGIAFLLFFPVTQEVALLGPPRLKFRQSQRHGVLGRYANDGHDVAGCTRDRAELDGLRRLHPTAKLHVVDLRDDDAVAGWAAGLEGGDDDGTTDFYDVIVFVAAGGAADAMTTGRDDVDDDAPSSHGRRGDDDDDDGGGMMMMRRRRMDGAVTTTTTTRAGEHDGADGPASLRRHTIRVGVRDRGIG